MLVPELHQNGSIHGIFPMHLDMHWMWVEFLDEVSRGIVAEIRGCQESVLNWPAASVGTVHATSSLVH